MSDDCTMTDVCHPSALDDSAETGGGDAMARGVGLMPSDAAAPTAPPPQEGVAQASCGSGEPVPEEPLPGEPLPEEPPQRRTMSRWNEWLLTPEVADQFTFEDGERIFEFSDSFSKTGWKPFDKSAQTQLRDIFRRMMYAESTLMNEVNCLGWRYDVKFDVFRTNRMEFANAPDDAIGYQLANHEKSKNSKRWIRLTTFRVGRRAPDAAAGRA